MFGCVLLVLLLNYVTFVVKGSSTEHSVILTSGSKLSFHYFVGIDRVGIYRRNGSYDDAMLLRRMIDEGRFQQINWEEYDIYTVGELIKTFLLQLPEPLLTYALSRRFLFTVSISDERLQKVGLCLVFVISICL